MAYPRQLPLYDAKHVPETWNERMTAGEFAIHYSGFEGRVGVVPFCTVFGSVEAAVAHAKEEVKAAAEPSLQNLRSSRAGGSASARDSRKGFQGE